MKEGDFDYFATVIRIQTDKVVRCIDMAEQRIMTHMTICTCMVFLMPFVWIIVIRWMLKWLGYVQ